ncbi:MAG TPA: ROK family protein [Mycobacteriales bacterium]
MLEPCRVSPVASINRAALGGRAARDLLGAPGLTALAAEAGLHPDGPVRSYLDRRLDVGDPAAEQVAAEYGRRLGTLLAALRAGERAVRPEWEHPSWWARWAAATTVWLGGGLAGGPFGALVAGRAGAEVGPGCRVVVAPDPADLPLLGAAYTSRRPHGPALVLDFGHSWVKRAVAGWDGGTLTGLRRLASVPAPGQDADGPEVAADVARILTGARAEAGDPAGPVVAAMAAYVLDGQPVRTPLGTYARLADVSADVPGWLAARTGVPVTLLHDGTAAAHALPPDPHAIVVLLGTSLGVGFPHPHQGAGHPPATGSLGG